MSLQGKFEGLEVGCVTVTKLVDCENLNEAFPVHGLAPSSSRGCFDWL